MSDNDDHSHEDVGCGKPPEHTRFRKGVSGNPRGRPKGAPSLSAIVERTLQEKVVIGRERSGDYRHQAGSGSQAGDQQGGIWRFASDEAAHYVRPCCRD